MRSSLVHSVPISHITEADCLEGSETDMGHAVKTGTYGVRIVALLQKHLEIYKN